MSVEQLKTFEFSTQTENILRNPPQLILVFDNYRKGNSILEIATMRTRAAIAAHIYHSDLYPTDEIRPTICCFAGKHTADSVPGSTRVALLLYQYDIPSSKIYTKENTFSTTTDLMQLQATIQAQRAESSIIVTTDDDVRRTKMAVNNHFARRGRNRKQYQIEVVGPSADIVNKICMSRDIDTQTRQSIRDAILLGKSDYLNGGVGETLATILAAIPLRLLRKRIQGCAEARTHKYTPPDLARIRFKAKRMWQSAKK